MFLCSTNDVALKKCLRGFICLCKEAYPLSFSVHLQHCAIPLINNKTNQFVFITIGRMKSKKIIIYIFNLDLFFVYHKSLE